MIFYDLVNYILIYIDAKEIEKAVIFKRNISYSYRMEVRISSIKMKKVAKSLGITNSTNITIKVVIVRIIMANNSSED